MVPVILLGLGFTTRRLARRFLCRGVPTFALVRNPDRFRELRSVGLITREFPENAVVVHTIPPLPAEENLALRESIRKLRPSRVVYISSTSVYGARTFADESTPPAPCDEKGNPAIRGRNMARRGRLADVNPSCRRDLWTRPGNTRAHSGRPDASNGTGRNRQQDSCRRSCRVARSGRFVPCDFIMARCRRPSLRQCGSCRMVRPDFTDTAATRLARRGLHRGEAGRGQAGLRR